MSDNDRDVPIDEKPYIGGVTVVNIGDLRVARGMSRRPYSGCPHTHLSYDTKERRIWCQDCERNIEAFDAFEKIVSRYDSAVKKVEKDRKDVEEAKAFQIRSRAAKAIDKVWRKRNMLPACPRCRNGLRPEDFANGVTTMVSREYDDARRLRDTPA